ncbi:MAG: AI-2E family transporter [Desulfovibrionaceae bacterium]
MTFDIGGWVRTNKVFCIWAFFFGLVWLILIQKLFGLLFITFILCFLFNKIINRLTRRLPVGRRVLTVLLYLVFIALVSIILSLVVPKLGSEAKHFALQLPKTEAKLHAYMDTLATEYPTLAPPLATSKQFLSLKKIAGMDGDKLASIAVASINQVMGFVSFFLLGTLFSFLILFDYPHLKERFGALRHSRIQDFYLQTVDRVVQFGVFVGEGFKAQFLISCCNTVLTAIGLWALGISPIVLLSVIVFTAGLIPVLGMLISTLPIMLLAFNSGGVEKVVWAMGMVCVVHLFETYVLNPRIFSAVFKISPVVTLIILFVAHHFAGLWGMILGVPVSVFIYRQLIMCPWGTSALDGDEDGPEG